MGFLMRKTQMLLNPFNSLRPLFARVCLPTPRSGCEASLNRRHHRKSASTDLNVLPYAELSLTKPHTPRSTATLQSA